MDETLGKLLPWEVIETCHGGDKEQFQQQVRERLKEYRRMERVTVAAEEELTCFWTTFEFLMPMNCKETATSLSSFLLLREPTRCPNPSRC